MKPREVTDWPQGKPAVKKACFSKREDIRPIENNGHYSVLARGKRNARKTFLGDSLPFSEEDCLNW